jgi:uroporphyrinogen decarboxylase
MSRADRFLNACRRQPVDTTPIWLMRQAGRYMQEYRDLRSQHVFLEMVKTPEIAAEVTLQPVNAFEVDAAIIFSDILPALEAVGITIEFIQGEGPNIPQPIREVAHIDALARRPAAEEMAYTMDAIRLVRQELDGTVPLIGFAGAPFTLASYAIEGGGSRDFMLAKRFMYSEAAAWHRFMALLAETVADVLLAQVAAGAQVVQMFDSWVGALSPGDYREYVLPYVKQVVTTVQAGAADVPFIYFGTGNIGCLPAVAEVPADVLGVDWRIELDRAWEIFGSDVAIQGNLDPILLMAPEAEMTRQAAAVLDAAGGRNGHIFNLGHGIIKHTDPDQVGALVDFVHAHGRRDA